LTNKKQLSAVLGSATLVFLVTKAAAFLAPMLLARGMSLTDYGNVELALAWGTPCAVLAGVGLNGAVPYFLLKLRRPEARKAFLLHLSMVTFILGIVAVLCHIAMPASVGLAVLVTAIFTAQNIYGALMRTDDRPALSSFLDVAIYSVLFVFAGVIVSLHAHVRMWEIFALFLVMTVTFFCISAYLWWGQQDRGRMMHIYREVITYGYPIIVTSFLNTILLSGGRILMGICLGVKEVGIYSLLFRMGSAAVVVHQIPTTVLFSRMYRATPKKLNLFLGLIQVSVLLTAIAIWLIGWPIGQRLFPVLRDDPAQVHRVMVPVVLQVYFWCVSAAQEFLFYREHWRKLYASLLLFIFAGLVGGTYFLKLSGTATLMTVAQLQMSITFLTAFGSNILLWYKGVRLPFPIILSAGIFAAYWIL
jgi:O-antigen/teichoic acid export membrane protein